MRWDSTGGLGRGGALFLVEGEQNLTAVELMSEDMNCTKHQRNTDNVLVHPYHPCNEIQTSKEKQRYNQSITHA